MSLSFIFLMTFFLYMKSGVLWRQWGAGSHFIVELIKQTWSSFGSLDGCDWKNKDTALNRERGVCLFLQFLLKDRCSPSYSFAVSPRFVLCVAPLDLPVCLQVWKFTKRQIWFIWSQRLLEYIDKMFYASCEVSGEINKDCAGVMLTAVN